jgi:hypothetical protein
MSDVPGFRRFVHEWNALQGLGTPRLHRNITAWLERCVRHGRRQLVLMVFRGAGKSSLTGLFCAWLLLRNPEHRILVLAADLTLAVKMVRNVRRIVERHPACAGLKPKKPDQWAAGQFTVARSGALRDPSMLGAGLLGNVTGSRAEVVICDDVEVPNNSGTPHRRDDLRERLAEIEYILVPGGLQLFIGTPHAKDSLYARDAADGEAPFLDGFTRFEAALFDGSGQSRWPERFTAEKIEALRRRSRPGRFMAQMLLQPADAEEPALRHDQVVAYDGELDLTEGNGVRILRLGGRLLHGAAAAWDPALGVRGRGDRSVTAAVFFDGDGNAFVHDVEYHALDPASLKREPEAIQLCGQVAAFADRLFLPSIQVEGNGIGAFLPGLLRSELARRGVACAVVPRTSAGAKHRRIVDALAPRLAAGKLHIHRRVLAGPFRDELEGWQPGARVKDDGLDAVAACLLSVPVRLRRHDAPERRPPWRAGGGAVSARTQFDPLDPERRDP